MEGRIEPKFEFAFSVRLKLGNVIRISGNTRGEDRYFVDVLEGTFEGPNLKGIVLVGTGGDYPLARPDGTLDFDARYFLREDDGTIIYLQNRGFRWGSPEVMKRLSNHEEVDISEYYMRTAPSFEVAAGPHDWLAKHIFVGIGQKTPEGNVINYYKML